MVSNMVYSKLYIYKEIKTLYLLQCTNQCDQFRIVNIFHYFDVNFFNFIHKTGSLAKTFLIQLSQYFSILVAPSSVIGHLHCWNTTANTAATSYLLLYCFFPDMV